MKTIHHVEFLIQEITEFLKKLSEMFEIYEQNDFWDPQFVNEKYYIPI